MTNSLKQFYNWELKKTLSALNVCKHHINATVRCYRHWKKKTKQIYMYKAVSEEMLNIIIKHDAETSHELT